MPIRPPVSNPPFNVVRASHVGLSVRDLGRARAFYVDCLGYLVSGETQDTLYLRAVEERNHHSIVLSKAADPRCGALGFKLASEDDLDRAAHWFGSKGLPAAFRETAHQGRTLRTSDPLGMPLEFYFKMDQGERMLQKYAAYRGARIQRIDHLNCFTPDVQAKLRFLHRTRLPPHRIYRDRRRRSQALGSMAAPQGQRPRPRLHQRPRPAPASRRRLEREPARHPPRLRRMATSGYLANMERGPGRHGISNAFFLYIRDRTVIALNCSPATISPSIRTLSRCAGRWTIRSARRCGAIRRPSLGSRKERSLRVYRFAIRCWRRSQWWQGEHENDLH